MSVHFTHIAVIVCSIYTFLVKKAVQVDVLTDGKMRSREMERTHRSTLMTRQADEKMEVERR